MSRGRRARHALLAPVEDPVLVELADAAFGGEAVGRLPDGRVVFVAHALPGESAWVRLQQDRRDFARADLVSVERVAPGRVEPPCPYFRAGCGGCSWQHADYPLQLALKQRIVADQLKRLGHFLDADELVRPAIGMLEPWGYRNQARFTVGRKFGELCFTYRGSHRLLRVDHCWIVHPAINHVVEALQGKLSIDAVPRRIHQLSIRVGANTGQTMVTPALPEIPDLESGQPFLEEDLLGRRFRLQPTSFFQVNTRREPRPLPDGLTHYDPRVAPGLAPANGLSMADMLALLVIDRLQPAPDDVIVDAYSGVGTFALLLAPLVRQVVAIEEARTAVQDARHNAQDLSNVVFVESRTEDALPNLEAVLTSAERAPAARSGRPASHPDAVIASSPHAAASIGALAASSIRRPSAVVLDPARVGCHPDVLRALLDLRPARVVYVSCDPSTLARDLRILVDGGYTLHSVQPLDMFPQTYHVESVSLLTL